MQLTAGSRIDKAVAVFDGGVLVVPDGGDVVVVDDGGALVVVDGGAVAQAEVKTMAAIFPVCRA